MVDIRRGTHSDYNVRDMRRARATVRQDVAISLRKGGSKQVSNNELMKLYENRPSEGQPGSIIRLYRLDGRPRRQWKRRSLQEHVGLIVRTSLFILFI